MTRRDEADLVLVIIVCSVIGVVFAMIVQILNTQGILIPSLLAGTSLTIAQLQFVIFFVWLLIGIILGATMF